MIRFFLLLFSFSTLCISCNGQERQTADNKNVAKRTPSIVTTADNKKVVSQLEQKLINSNLVCINEKDTSIYIDLKYATTDNFTKVVLYDSLSRAYLHPIAAEKLLKAQKLLKAKHPDLTLLVYDAARPLSVQKKMFQVVQGTKHQAYVANPTRTGLHNYGIAVDLTICDLTGKPLDMGTPFDFFGKEAGITNESAYLTKKQIENRNLLRSVMTGAGFLTIRGEWWHFNALSLAESKKRCKLLE